MPTTRRLPRAGEDPIDGAGPAMALIHQIADRPLTDQTIALLLDQRRCGISAMVVHGTGRPEHVLDVACVLAEVARHAPQLDAIVLASVRATPPVPDPPSGPDDVDRWLEMSDVASTAGLELVEWFVVDPVGVRCPRDLLGEPERW